MSGRSFGDLTDDERRAYFRERKRVSRAKASSGDAPALTHDAITRALVEAVAVLLERDPVTAGRVVELAATAFAFPPGACLRISRHLRRLRRSMVADAVPARSQPADGGDADPMLQVALERMAR